MSLPRFSSPGLPLLAVVAWLLTSWIRASLHLFNTAKKKYLHGNCAIFPTRTCFAPGWNVSLIWTSLTRVIYTDNWELLLLQSLEWYLHSPCSSETGFKASITNFFGEVSLIAFWTFKRVHTSSHFLVYYCGDHLFGASKNRNTHSKREN